MTFERDEQRRSALLSRCSAAAMQQRPLDRRPPGPVTLVAGALAGLLLIAPGVGGEETAEITLQLDAAGEGSECSAPLDLGFMLADPELLKQLLALAEGPPEGQPRALQGSRVEAALASAVERMPGFNEQMQVLGAPAPRRCASGCLILPAGIRYDGVELSTGDGTTVCVPSSFDPRRGSRTWQPPPAESPWAVDCGDATAWANVANVRYGETNAVCGTSVNWSADSASLATLRLRYSHLAPLPLSTTGPWETVTKRREPGLRCTECERSAYRKEVAGLLLRGQFDTLEREVASLRRTRPRFSSGEPVLFDFYQGLDPLRDGSPKDERGQKRLEQWTRAHPESATPRVARALLHQSAAWRARGGDYAAKVSEKAWETFRSHNHRAWELALEARRLEASDPAIHDLILTVGMNLDHFSDAHAAFEEGTRLDATYQHLYVVMARNLLPRWHGTRELVQAFAEESAERTRPELGDALYARIAAEVVALYGGGDPGLAPLFPWERLHQGFADLDRMYPESIFVLSLWARMAWIYGDRDTARDLISRLGDESLGRDVAATWGLLSLFQQAQRQLRHQVPQN